MYLYVLELWATDHEPSFNISKCCVLPIEIKNFAPLFIEKTKLQIIYLSFDLRLEGTSIVKWVYHAIDLRLEGTSIVKWVYHARNKLQKTRRIFRILQQCTPRNIPAGVKLNIFRACAISILLQC